MRIIAGTHRSRRLIAPDKLPVRPTTGRAKEALFSIIESGYYFDEKTVLDLYSGTGNIAYEFASRGTQQILSVDQNLNCIRFIQKTAEELGFKAITTLKADVFEFVTKHKQEYDVIFADAPYDIEGLESVIENIFKHDLLANNGVLILEHPKEQDFSELPNYINKRRYGNVNFSFFERNEEVEN